MKHVMAVAACRQMVRRPDALDSPEDGRLHARRTVRELKGARVGSIRMEPVFFALGQAAGAAAALASSRNSAVQDVPYEELAARLPIVGDTGRALAVSAARD